MATIQFCPEANLSRPRAPEMNAFRFAFRSKLFFAALELRHFCASAFGLRSAEELLRSGWRPPVLPRSIRVSATVSGALLKEEWLDSLSFPFSEKVGQDLHAPDGEVESDSGAEWVIGIDPDVSGAVALLKPDGAGYSSQASNSMLVLASYCT